jgi:GrpB-like predicted nucleotidyltransferase (UPF0157 family)
MESLGERVERLVREEIVIVPYDPRWPEWFRSEKMHLIEVLPADLVRRIEHFGSTAVPGLSAKPIVDILVEITDLEAAKGRIAPLLESEGYEYFWRPTFGDDVPPFYAWFIKRDPSTRARTHHIHMITAEPQFEEFWDRLLFRDYLIEQPELARQYERLKTAAASQFNKDRVGYTVAKSEFIERITKEAAPLSR